MGKDVEILGVVGPRGVSGCSGGRLKKWSMSFLLECWRIKGEPLRETPLRVEKSVSSRELDSFQQRIAEYDVVAIRAVLTRKSGQKTLFCDLAKLVGKNRTDTELLERAKQLQAPIVVEDEFFGTLTYDRRIDWYEGRVAWNKRKVRVAFPLARDEDLGPLLKRARAFWKAQVSWDRRVRDYAVKRLLALKNESWLEDGERELTAKQFKDRMKLESITFCPDGRFEFWHDDGGLFWGHSILVSGSTKKGPTGADIAG